MATIKYSTLDQFKVQLKASSSNSGQVTTFSTVDENTAQRAMLTVAARINKLRPTGFVPLIETRDVVVSTENVNSYLNTIVIPDPLLVLQGVTLGTTTLTVGTDVTTYPSNTPYPYRQLRLIGSYFRRSWYDYCAAPTNDLLFLSVTGVWGYKERYATQGWLAYDTLQANINASVTTLTVADADGTDPQGFTPRFSVGQLIQIGTEWLEVTAVSTVTNTLTVRRGVQGSTAAAHSQTDVIYSFQIEDDIVRIATQQACMLFARKGAYATAEISDLGTVTYPADLLAELEHTLSYYDYA